MMSKSTTAPSPANSLQRQASGRFRKGVSGNPKGMKPGTKRQATRLAEALLDGEADRLVRKAIDMALGGDVVALRICLERLMPVQRERMLNVRLPALNEGSDAVKALAATVAAIAAGDITASEGTQLSKIIADFASAVMAGEHEQRLAALEQKLIEERW
jgi:hypothetical protein